MEMNNIEDIKTIKVGEKYNGKIIGINKNGYDVEINKLCRGYMLNYLCNNEIKFGEIYKFIILSKNIEKNKIFVSCNKELVESKYPIIDNYQISNNSIYYTGFIEKVYKSYLIIKFLNNVSGLLHISEMFVTSLGDLEKVYKPGMILNVRVLSNDIQKHRLCLTMNEKISESIVNINNRIVVLSEPKINENNIYFKVNGFHLSSFCAVVPEYHLSDFDDNRIYIKKMLNNHDIKLVGVYLGKDLLNNYDIFSCKQSIIRSVENKTYPINNSDVYFGQIYPGFVLSKVNKGINIMIGFNVIGFLPSSHNELQIGQSILVKVIEIDHTRNRIILSSDIKGLNEMSFIPSYIINSGLFLSYIKEHGFISKNILNTKIFKRGLLKNIIITKKYKSYYKGLINNISCVIYYSSNNNYKIGDKISAYSLYWTFKPCVVYCFINNPKNNISSNYFNVKVVKVLKWFSLGITTDDNNVGVFIITKEHISGKRYELDKGDNIECNYLTSFNGYHIVSGELHDTLFSTRRGIECKIISISNTDLKVKYSNKCGYIHISNIGIAKEGDKPLERFRVDDKLRAYIIPKRSRYTSLSTTVISNRLELCLNPNFYFSPSTLLNVNQKVIGFVCFIDSRRLYVEICPNVKGYINRIDLYKNNEDQSYKYNVSSSIELKVLRLRGIKSNYIFIKEDISNRSEIKMGDIVNGIVYKHHDKDGLYIDLPNTYRGVIHITNISNIYEDNIMNNYPLGSYVEGKVIGIMSNNRYNICMKSVMNFSLDKQLVCIDKIYNGYIYKISTKYIYIYVDDSITGRINIFQCNKIYGNGWNKNISLHKVLSIKIIEKVNEHLYKVIPSKVGDNDDIVIDHNVINKMDDIQIPLKIGEKFDWKNGEYIGIEKDVEVNNNELSHNNMVVCSKKYSEVEMRNIENLLAKNELIPTNPDDFDRIIMSSCNSSILWIQYMCYYLQGLELDKARNISQRALKMINISESKERLNIWKSIINMECLYGTNESFNDVYNLAKNSCNKKHIIHHVIDLLQNTNEVNNCEKQCLLLLKFYSKSKSSYIKYARFLIIQHRFIEMKQLLKKAIQNLHKNKHIFVIVQFALLEYKYGDIGRGSTYFQNILHNYPQRIDIWYTYIDQLIKYKCISQARVSFNQILSLPLKDVKKKSILSKFIQFEKQYGESKTVELLQQQLSLL